jgi:hypothetical protein
MPFYEAFILKRLPQAHRICNESDPPGCTHCARLALRRVVGDNMSQRARRNPLQHVRIRKSNQLSYNCHNGYWPFHGICSDRELRHTPAATVQSNRG